MKILTEKLVEKYTSETLNDIVINKSNEKYENNVNKKQLSISDPVLVDSDEIRDIYNLNNLSSSTTRNLSISKNYCYK